MAPRSAWRALGIEPTSDVRAVKRAYAAKLKAIDPDADVAAFLRLRDALAAAEADAAYRAAREASDGDEEEEDEDDWLYDADNSWAGSGILARSPTIAWRAPVEPVAEPESETASEPVPPETEPAFEPPFERAPEPDPEPAEPDRRQAVADALFPGRGAVSDPQEVIEAVQALLVDPRMANLDFAAETEDWLAYVLVQAGPAADPVIPGLVRVYNWAAELNLARPRHYVAWLAQRAEDLIGIAALSDPKHRWNAAFRTLQQPAPKRIALASRLRLATPVNELLESIRHHHPAIEELFDADHVALWTKQGPAAGTAKPAPNVGGISWFGFGLILWVLVLVARLIVWGMSL